MTGTLISARMIPAVSRLVPCVAPPSCLARCSVVMILSHVLPGSAVKTHWTIGPSTIRPMKPQTMEGMAASSSITIFSVSFTLPLANSEM